MCTYLHNKNSYVIVKLEINLLGYNKQVNRINELRFGFWVILVLIQQYLEVFNIAKLLSNCNLRNSQILHFTIDQLIRNLYAKIISVTVIKIQRKQQSIHIFTLLVKKFDNCFLMTVTHANHKLQLLFFSKQHIYYKWQLIYYLHNQSESQISRWLIVCTCYNVEFNFRIKQGQYCNRCKYSLFFFVFNYLVIIMFS
eukprot:TRINITY_DN46946_c0_g1_i4.p1 TRINITY_DN46946_c0_g1~~TRINITY_DN46946_c0_g1_i4.p1  ORF type:complete len:197 (+),score=-15.55 TRINITY_DN46946_c0_g1_i4:489-1079(+)